MVGGSDVVRGDWLILMDKDTGASRFIVGYSYDAVVFSELVSDFLSSFDDESNENMKRLRNKYVYDYQEWSEDHPAVKGVAKLASTGQKNYITIISTDRDRIMEAVKPDLKYIKDFGDLNLFFTLIPHAKHESDKPLIFGIITNRKNFDGVRYLKSVGMEEYIEPFTKNTPNICMLSIQEFDQNVQRLKKLNIM